MSNYIPIIRYQLKQRIQFHLNSFIMNSPILLLVRAIMVSSVVPTLCYCFVLPALHKVSVLTAPVGTRTITCCLSLSIA